MDVLPTIAAFPVARVLLGWWWCWWEESTMALDTQHMGNEGEWCCFSLSHPESEAEARCATIFIWECNPREQEGQWKVPGKQGRTEMKWRYATELAHKRRLSVPFQGIVLQEPESTRLRKVLSETERGKHLSTSSRLPLARPHCGCMVLCEYRDHQKEESHWTECIFSPEPTFLLPCKVFPSPPLLWWFCGGGGGGGGWGLLYLDPNPFVWSSSSFFLLIFLSICLSFCYWFLGVLYIFWIKVFSFTHVTNIFSYSVAFPGLMTYIIFLKRMEVLNFNIVEMINFPFMVCAFVSGLRILLYLEVIKYVKYSILVCERFSHLNLIDFVLQKFLMFVCVSLVCVCVCVRYRETWLD